MTRATPRKTPAPRPTELQSLPGHCIRRLQQIAVAIFMQESGATGVTPVQFAVLQALAAQGGIDQRSLARAVSFDTSTIGGVIDRLESRGFLTRSLSATDRRVRLLDLTPAGEALLAQLTPSMQRTQKRILEPLPARDRKEFMRMVQAVVGHHEALGQADAEL
ncbi:MAG: transcriptional regulator [Ramlibacter sp.]|jgi:DNA-binding MarR family transcriptional regulator|uniref:MarR family winged helix-turn-helix transcriptional regulator n=1 Tax=Ramlibacter sp. TaxID=1917967 RepID=UPI0026243EC4|nr:MarR family transcriptional regulator [Ramlibacter sp.]MDB5749741.1 transcriptional regulator [Ramlibacter sp.]